MGTTVTGATDSIEGLGRAITELAGVVAIFTQGWDKIKSVLPVQEAMDLEINFYDLARTMRLSEPQTQQLVLSIERLGLHTRLSNYELLEMRKTFSQSVNWLRMSQAEWSHYARVLDREFGPAAVSVDAKLQSLFTTTPRFLEALKRAGTMTRQELRATEIAAFFEQGYEASNLFGRALEEASDYSLGLRDKNLALRKSFRGITDEVRLMGKALSDKKWDIVNMTFATDEQRKAMLELQPVFTRVGMYGLGIEEAILRKPENIHNLMEMAFAYATTTVLLGAPQKSGPGGAPPMRWGGIGGEVAENLTAGIPILGGVVKSIRDVATWSRDKGMPAITEGARKVVTLGLMESLYRVVRGRGKGEIGLPGVESLGTLAQLAKALFVPIPASIDLERKLGGARDRADEVDKIVEAFVKKGGRSYLQEQFTTALGGGTLYKAGRSWQQDLRTVAQRLQQLAPAGGGAPRGGDIMRGFPSGFLPWKPPNIDIFGAPQHFKEFWQRFTDEDLPSFNMEVERIQRNLQLSQMGGETMMETFQDLFSVGLYQRMNDVRGLLENIRQQVTLVPEGWKAGEMLQQMIDQVSLSLKRFTNEWREAEEAMFQAEVQVRRSRAAFLQTFYQQAGGPVEVIRQQIRDQKELSRLEMEWHYDRVRHWKEIQLTPEQARAELEMGRAAELEYRIAKPLEEIELVFGRGREELDLWRSNLEAVKTAVQEIGAPMGTLAALSKAQVDLSYQDWMNRRGQTEETAKLVASLGQNPLASPVVWEQLKAQNQAYSNMIQQLHSFHRTYLDLFREMELNLPAGTYATAPAGKPAFGQVMGSAYYQGRGLPDMMTGRLLPLAARGGGEGTYQELMAPYAARAGQLAGIPFDPRLMGMERSPMAQYMEKMWAGQQQQAQQWMEGAWLPQYNQPGMGVALPTPVPQGGQGQRQGGGLWIGNRQVGAVRIELDPQAFGPYVQQQAQQPNNRRPRAAGPWVGP